MIEIYKNDEKLNFDEVLLKDFGENLIKLRENIKIDRIDFYSINKLKGEKTLLEKAFRDEKTEQLNY